MHLADGVLSTKAVIGTSIAAGALIINAVKRVDNEEIPKISIMTAAFFVFGLMSYPAGPSTVHPLLGGLLGIMLGWRSPLAVFIGLILHAGIFQHGGFTTLGINTLIVAIPAIIGHLVFKAAMKKDMKIGISAGITASLSVALTVAILLTVLAMVNENYKEIIFILGIGHIPLLIGEGILTGIVIKFLNDSRPEILAQYNINN